MVIWVMVILMGMFLVGSVGVQQLSQMFRPTGEKAVLGYAAGATITGADVNRAGKDIEVLRMLGIGNPMRMIQGQAVPGDREYLFFLTMADQRGEVERNAAWVMLVNEAKAMGMQAGDETAERFVLRLFGNDEKAYRGRLAELRRQGVLEAEVLRATGNLMLVTMAFEAVAGGAAPSERDLRSLYKDVETQLGLAMVRFDAQDYLDDVPAQPAGDDPAMVLRDQWSELKQYQRGDPASPHPLKFGYRRPPRVQLEVAYIDWDDVADTVRPSEDEIYDYWRSNPEQFGQPSEDQAATQSAEETGRRYAMDKAEARRRVRQLRTAREIKRLTAALLREAKLLEANPEDVESGTPISAAAETLTGEIPVRYRSDGQWLTAGQIAADPLLGAAQTERGAPLVYLAFRLKELMDEQEAGQALVKTGEVFGRVMSVANVRDGQVDPNDPIRATLIWRVVNARPSEEPELYAEDMREQVLRDWRVAQAYEMAKTKANEAKIRAAEVGLADVAKEMDAEIVNVESLSRRALIDPFQPQRGDSIEQMVLRRVLTRPVAVVPGVGEDAGVHPREAQDFLDQAMELAGGDEPIEQAIDEPAPTAALKVIPLPLSRSVLLAQRVSYTPAYEQDYLGDDEPGEGAEGVDGRDELLSALQANARFDLLSTWFEIGQIKTRTGFVQKTE